MIVWRHVTKWLTRVIESGNKHCDLRPDDSFKDGFLVRIETFWVFFQQPMAAAPQAVLFFCSTSTWRQRIPFHFPHNVQGSRAVHAIILHHTWFCWHQTDCQIWSNCHLHLWRREHTVFESLRLGTSFESSPRGVSNWICCSSTRSNALGSTYSSIVIAISSRLSATRTKCYLCSDCHLRRPGNVAPFLLSWFGLRHNLIIQDPRNWSLASFPHFLIFAAQCVPLGLSI